LIGAGAVAWRAEGREMIERAEGREMIECADGRDTVGAE
jgi:hypothetical protein